MRGRRRARQSLDEALRIDTAVRVGSARWHRRRVTRRWLQMWLGTATMAAGVSVLVGMASRPGDSGAVGAAWVEVWMASYRQLAPLAAGTAVSTIATIAVTLFVATSIVDSRPPSAWPPRAELARREVLNTAAFGTYVVGATLVWLHLPPVLGPEQHSVLDAALVVVMAALLTLLGALQATPPEVRRLRLDRARQTAARAGWVLARLEPGAPSSRRSVAALSGVSLVAGAATALCAWAALPAQARPVGFAGAVGLAGAVAAMHVAAWPVITAEAVVERYVWGRRSSSHWWLAAALGLLEGLVVAALLALGARAGALLYLAVVALRLVWVRWLRRAPLARRFAVWRASRLAQIAQGSARQIESLTEPGDPLRSPS